jgi:hypothetical protein
MAERSWREEAAHAFQAFHTYCLSTLVIAALVYFVRFALLLGVEAALFYRVARNTCRPLADLSTEETLGGAIPQEATCYTRDHEVIAFHDFHPLAEDPIPAILTAGLLLCFLGLFFWPGFWVGGYRARHQTWPQIRLLHHGPRHSASWLRCSGSDSEPDQSC